jgi:hypothetical protein
VSWAYNILGGAGLQPCINVHQTRAALAAEVTESTHFAAAMSFWYPALSVPLLFAIGSSVG